MEGVLQVYPFARLAHIVPPETYRLMIDKTLPESYLKKQHGVRDFAKYREKDKDFAYEGRFRLPLLFCANRRQLLLL